MTNHDWILEHTFNEENMKQVPLWLNVMCNLAGKMNSVSMNCVFKLKSLLTPWNETNDEPGWKEYVAKFPGHSKMFGE